jgi:hypothetical protein
LAARHADDQVQAVMPALADKDLALRIGALKALGTLAGGGEAQAMVKVLKEATDKGELEAAEAALIAAAPRQGDACVNAVAQAVEGATPANGAAMVRALGPAATGKAMTEAVKQTKNANADIRDAAVRVLAEWREKPATTPLLEIAQTSDNDTHRILALRGILRLTDKIEAKYTSERLRLVEGVLKAAKRPEEKRSALGLLQSIQTVESLQLAAPCLDDDAVKEEAAAAVVKIAEKLVSSGSDTTRDALRAALEKAATAKNSDVKSKAEEYLKRVKK